MKKVKIMLTAIAVLAIVGGVLAFKAKNLVSICYYSDVNPHDGGIVQGYCPNTTLDFTTVTDPGGNIYNTTALPGAEGCPDFITCTKQYLTDQTE